MTIDKAKFRKPVVPGDQVEFHMTTHRQAPQHLVVSAARRGSTASLVCEAEVSAMLVNE